jgi:transcriptional regulator with XRE-family HTH domain
MIDELPTALQGTASLREKLARTRPSFAAAIAREQRVEGFCQDIRAQLKVRRELLGLGQAEIATKLEIGQSAVSKLENGNGDIGLKTLFRYADALGVKPFVLFIPSEDRIAEQIVESRADTTPAESHMATAGAVQEAQEHLLRTVSDALPEVVAKLAAA